MTKNLAYWKNNAEEDYIGTPISVLRYITELEKQQERMYSEEEVENIIYKLFEDYASNYTNKALKEFENFKKK
jgi:hypothetical protein